MALYPFDDEASDDFSSPDDSANNPNNNFNNNDDASDDSSSGSSTGGNGLNLLGEYNADGILEFRQVNSLEDALPGPSSSDNSSWPPPLPQAFASQVFNTGNNGFEGQSPQTYQSYQHDPNLYSYLTNPDINPWLVGIGITDGLGNPLPYDPLNPYFSSSLISPLNIEQESLRQLQEQSFQPPPSPGGSNPDVSSDNGFNPAPNVSSPSSALASTPLPISTPTPVSGDGFSYHLSGQPPLAGDSSSSDSQQTNFAQDNSVPDNSTSLPEGGFLQSVGYQSQKDQTPSSPAQPSEFEVYASEFSGGKDVNYSAYPPYNKITGNGPLIDPNKLGASLPAKVQGQPVVRVTNPQNGKYVDVPLIDVGPFNEHDPYWTNATSNYRPLTEEQHRKKMRTSRGTRINPAGIDLTPGTFRSLGIKPPKNSIDPNNSILTKVRWKFINPVQEK